ncbi:MAG: cytochrome oxidase small assembly protein [Burkholderiaceae bacterium]
MDDRKQQRSKNLRLALVLVTIVLAFFIGALVKQAYFG